MKRLSVSLWLPAAARRLSIRLVCWAHECLASRLGVASQKSTSHFVMGRYHELYDVVDLFVVLEMGGSVSHNLEYIRKHRPRLNFDPTLFDRRFRNKTLHVKLDGSLMHSSNPFENQGMMRTHGFASAYRRARGCRGHTVGKDGISNDLLLLSDIRLVSAV